MEREQKSSPEREVIAAATPKRREPSSGIRLHIEELESRLAPQSTATILD